MIERRRRWDESLLGGFLLAVAAGVAGASLLHLVTALRFNRNAVRGEARVLGIDSEEIESGPVPDPVGREDPEAWQTRSSMLLTCRIELTTEGGRQVETSLPCNGPLGQLQDDRVTVLYDPGDPRHVRFSPYELIWFQLIACVAFSAVCTLVACRVLSARTPSR